MWWKEEAKKDVKDQLASLWKTPVVKLRQLLYVLQALKLPSLGVLRLLLTLTLLPPASTGHVKQRHSRRQRGLEPLDTNRLWEGT